LSIYFGGNASIYSSTVNYPHAVNVQSFVRVSRNSTTGNVMFFTSLNGITYTQLGTTVAGATGAIDYDAVPLRIGAIATSLAQVFSGAIEYVKLFKDDTFTTATQFFDPTSYNASVSQTTIPSSTGEVYTLNVGTASTGYKVVIVDKTIIQSNGIDTTFATLTIARNQPYTEYIVGRRLGTGNFLERATGNIRGHDATNYSLNNGVLLNLANTSRNRQLLTYRSNGASSGMAVNNGSETTGDAGTNNGTDLTVLGGNHSLNSLIVSTDNDTGAARTAIYNYLKTINTGL